jgi:hypothetical protein
MNDCEDSNSLYNYGVVAKKSPSVLPFVVETGLCKGHCALCATQHATCNIVVRGLLATRVTSEEDWRCRIVRTRKDQARSDARERSTKKAAAARAHDCVAVPDTYGSMKSPTSPSHQQHAAPTDHRHSQPARQQQSASKPQASLKKSIKPETKSN